MRTDISKIGDKQLVQRIEEFLDNKRAIEIKLTELVAEYGRRRIAVVRAGETLTGPLAEPLALSEHTRNSLLRREQVAAQHHEADQDVLRDPRTPNLVS
jgi:hypothetical protein